MKISALAKPSRVSVNKDLIKPHLKRAMFMMSQSASSKAGVSVKLHMKRSRLPTAHQRLMRPLGVDFNDKGKALNTAWKHLRAEAVLLR
jgi:hypothetical protein